MTERLTVSNAQLSQRQEQSAAKQRRDFLTSLRSEPETGNGRQRITKFIKGLSMAVILTLIYLFFTLSILRKLSPILNQFIKQGYLWMIDEIDQQRTQDWITEQMNNEWDKHWTVFIDPDIRSYFIPNLMALFRLCIINAKYILICDDLYYSLLIPVLCLPFTLFISYFSWVGFKIYRHN